MSDRLDAAIRELVLAIREEVLREARPVAEAPDRLLSIAEASALTGVARSTFYHEMDAGRIRSVKVGRRRLVPMSSIAERIDGTGAPP